MVDHALKGVRLVQKKKIRGNNEVRFMKAARLASSAASTLLMSPAFIQINIDFMQINIDFVRFGLNNTDPIQYTFNQINSHVACLHSHLRVDARQSQKSIPQIYRGIDVESHFALPPIQSMAPTAEPNCSSKSLRWSETHSYESDIDFVGPGYVGHGREVFRARGRTPSGKDNVPFAIALPTETKVECGTSQSKSGTSVNLSDSGNLSCVSHDLAPSTRVEGATVSRPFPDAFRISYCNNYIYKLNSRKFTTQNDLY